MLLCADGASEIILGQAFVLQYKTIVIPEQAFDHHAPAIGKDTEATVKRIVSRLLLNNLCQTTKFLMEIDRVTVQVDTRYTERRALHTILPEMPVAVVSTPDYLRLCP